MDSKLYRKAIATYFDNLNKGYDSLITLNPMQSFFLDKNGPINFETGLNHKNSEYLDPIYHFTNGINIAPKRQIAKWHYNYGPNPYKLMVNKREAIDIDDIYDYVQALAMHYMPENVDNIEIFQNIENMFSGGQIKVK